MNVSELNFLLFFSISIIKKFNFFLREVFLFPNASLSKEQLEEGIGLTSASLIAFCSVLA